MSVSKVEKGCAYFDSFINATLCVIDITNDVVSTFAIDSDGYRKYLLRVAINDALARFSLLGKYAYKPTEFDSLDFMWKIEIENV